MTERAKLIELGYQPTTRFVIVASSDLVCHAQSEIDSTDLQEVLDWAVLFYLTHKKENTVSLFQRWISPSVSGFNDYVILDGIKGYYQFDNSVSHAISDVVNEHWKR